MFRFFGLGLGKGANVDEIFRLQSSSGMSTMILKVNGGDVMGLRIGRLLRMGG